MSKINLLLFEDDPNLGLLLKEYLIAKGFDVTLKTNGEEGYEAFVKGSFQFLILDVMMPVKDGFTLAEEIRGIDKDVPILFLHNSKRRSFSLVVNLVNSPFKNSFRSEGLNSNKPIL